MTREYWSQWSHSELMSMQGVELDDSEMEQDEVDVDLDQEDEEYSGAGCRGCHGCMDCLGMSWRDFM